MIIISQNIAIAIVALSSLIMLAALIRPLMMLRWYLIMRPVITPFAYWQYSIGFLPIGTPYLAILTLGGLVSASGKGSRIMPGKLILMFLFIAFCLPSLIIAPSFFAGMTALVKYTAGIAAYLVAYNCINSKKDLKYLLFSLVVLSPIIPLIFGLYQYVTATGNMFTHQYHDPRRIASVFAMYNHFGEYLNIVTFVLLGMIISKEYAKQRKWLWLILAVVCLEALLSQNRGAWIGLVAGIGGSVLIYRKVFPIKLLAIGGTLIFLLGGAYIAVRFSDLGADSNTLTGRLNIGRALLAQAMESPFTGKGIGFSGMLEYKPHNDYLWVFLENGILAMLMFLFFNISNILSHIRNRKTESWRWIQFSFCGISIYFLIISFFQNILYNPSSFPFFMTCFGVASKLMLLDEEPEKKEQAEEIEDFSSRYLVRRTKA